LTHDINIKEIIEDKQSWFNIKRFQIGNTSFERPIKTLDGKDLTKKSLEFASNNYTFPIREYTKVIKSYAPIDELYSTDDDSKINHFFFKTNWLNHIPSLINFTFEFNPFDYVKNIDTMSGFFDYYYNYVSMFLTIPNIRISKKIKVTDVDSKTGKEIQTYKKKPIIKINQYLEFVDSSYTLLNIKNKKPIFVPISLRMSFKQLDQLLQHYLKKQYYYYWLDFEGKSINSTTLSRLRRIFTKIKDSGNFDRTISHFTNIKREITSNTKLDDSPASDILSSIAGANIIGVNREPPPPPAIFDAPEKSLPDHKARLFNNNSYYYIKSTDPAFYQKNVYTTNNSVRLDQELNNQNKYFIKNLQISDFLNEKQMLQIHESGKILKELISKSSERANLSDFY
jgi:hypothetical protein